MPAEVWKVVVVPLLGKEESVVVGITTPMVGENFFSKLVNKRDADGNPLFLIYTLELACKRCKDRDRGHLCPHNMRLLPPFKSVVKQKIMNILLSDDVETTQRENFGIMSTSYNSFIEKTFIDQWLNNPMRFDPPDGYYADTLIIAVDPNRAGTKGSSEMAMATIALKFGLYCLVGLETHPADDYSDVNRLVNNALDAYESTEWLQGAQVILATEDNTGHEAGYIAHFAKKRPNVHPIYNPTRTKRAGLATTRYNKPEYAMAARHRIQMGQLSIAKKLIVGNTELRSESGSLVPQDQKGDYMLAKLEKQMRRYVQVDTKSDSVFATERVTMSGVIDREGRKDPTVNDDLMFALTFACRVADLALQGQIENLARDWLPKTPVAVSARAEKSRKRKIGVI